MVSEASFCVAIVSSVAETGAEGSATDVSAMTVGIKIGNGGIFRSRLVP